MQKQYTIQSKICHTVNSGSEMVEAKHVSGENIYWSTFIDKSKGRKIFDFLHCPFEPPAKQHRPVCQLGWIFWCMLARPSKGQCRNSKIFPPLLLAVKVDQHIIFPETCFAATFLSLNSQCGISKTILTKMLFLTLNGKIYGKMYASNFRYLSMH